jgi:hypothetical protein
MSRVNNLRGTYITVLMGDGATPEVFTVLCGITAKSMTTQVNTSDEFNRDCAQPEDVPVRELIATGKQWSIRGSGQMNRDLEPMLDAAVGHTKNFRFFIARKVGEVAPALNGYYGGPAMITSKVLSGDDAAKAAIDLSIESDGAWAWTAVP